MFIGKNIYICGMFNNYILLLVLLLLLFGILNYIKLILLWFWYNLVLL